MPLFGSRDRYQRLDAAAGGGGRKPTTSFCSSATVVVFVALGLVAAWMMASSSNVVLSVPSESNNKAEAKEAVEFAAQRGNGGGGDATQTSNEGKKDGGGDGGDMPKTADGDKDAGAGATRATDDGGGTGGGVEADGASNLAAAGAVTEGDTPSGNQTFSDENGKMEGGEVAKPEDPDHTEVEQSAEEATTGGQPNNAKPEVTDDKDQVAKSGQEASTTDANSDSGGQSDSGSRDQETPTEGNGGQGRTPKNGTIFGDTNGKVDDRGEVAAKSFEGGASNVTVQTTDDETAAAGVAAKNGTSGEQSEAIAFAAADDTSNGTVSIDVESATATNRSATTEGKTPEKAELLPSGQADLLNETASVVAEQATFPTQVAESSEEEEKKNKQKKKKSKGVGGETTTAYTWKLCNVTAGADYIPCLDNEAAIKKLKTTKHYEHRERHCPATPPTCLVSLPDGYRQPIPWPHSRDKIWYHNVPHTKLATYKGHQNWVKVSGEHLTFPGGGTQFKNGGAAHYIELMQDALPEIAWGQRSRVVLDVGCGVASFGGFLFDKDALTMSFAPKDEHEAQVQFALERGIPAVSAVMGTLRLPFPGNVFDAIHCARCRVPWHIEGGKLLIEVNRLLRPGGLFIWSATPVYRKVPEDVEIWQAMAALTKSMCWEMVKKTSDTVDQTAMVVFKKPSSNDCYDARTRADPPLCEASDDQNAAWNITLQTCMHRVPTDASARGSRWPGPWPERLATAPYWLSEEQTGVYGKPAPADFAADQEHWRRVVQYSYRNGMGIDWTHVRNVMDMRAVYGGFAAALRDMNLWVMNVVPIDSPDTLPVVYERGLFGMYHDWCESFSTYPRSFDVVHADHLFSGLKKRCELLPVMAEVDRILRPDGELIVRDVEATVEEVRSIAESLHWEVRMTVSRQGEELLCVRKTTWRPSEVEARS